MKNTKNKILLVAKELFNQDGVPNTTLRKIAKHLNISQGNLNYHYKKREDIIEALYFEMVAEFDQRIQRTVNQSISLKIIFEESRLSMLRMYEYRFIWIDLHQIIRENEKIKAHFVQAQARRKAGLQMVFKELIRNDIIQEESFPHEHEELFQRLINFGDFWICSIDIYQSEFNPKDVDEKHKVYFGFFYPYLTEKGKQLYSALVL